MSEQKGNIPKGAETFKIGKVDATGASSEISSSGQYDILQDFRKMDSRKEKANEGRLEIRIDREALERISEEVKRDEQMQEASNMPPEGQRQSDMMERFLRLPENMQFKPGIVLITGRNGSGKSTLLKSLFLASQYQAIAEISGQAQASTEVYGEGSMSIGHDVFLKQAGLAPKLAQSLNAEITGKNIDDLKYLDTSAFAEERKLREQELPINKMVAAEKARIRMRTNPTIETADPNEWARLKATARSENEDLGIGKGAQSRRQTIDARMKEVLRQKGPASIYFLDEPESGADPRRQREQINELKALAEQNSLVLVASNSLAFYEDPNINRIDLDEPELGVYRPIDHNPEYQI